MSLVFVVAMAVVAVLPLVLQSLLLMMQVVVVVLLPLLLVVMLDVMLTFICRQRHRCIFFPEGDFFCFVLFQVRCVAHVLH